MAERRNKERFEPQAVKATFSLSDHSDHIDKYNGYVLDACSDGMAISLSKNTSLPTISTEGAIIIKNEDSGIYKDISGVIIRSWENCKHRGFSIKFNDLLSDETAKKILFNGITKMKRLEKQKGLAQSDISNLEHNNRSYQECIMKLFIVALTVSATLVGVYFGLKYHGFSNMISNQGGTLSDTMLVHINRELSFWRSMIALVPGILSVAVALLISQKLYSINRAEAFLDILKQNLVNDLFPREYRGWEAALRKYKYCKGSNKCDDCFHKQGCGELTNEENTFNNKIGFFKKPFPSVYYVVLYGILFSLISFSLLITIYEFLAFGWGNLYYLITGIMLNSVLVFLGSIMALFIWNIRKGAYSFLNQKRVWSDLLERCPYQP